MVVVPVAKIAPPLLVSVVLPSNTLDKISTLP